MGRSPTRPTGTPYGPAWPPCWPRPWYRQRPGRGAALKIAAPILAIAFVVNLCLLPFARRPDPVSLETVAALAALGVIGTAANYALMTAAFRRPDGLHVGRAARGRTGRKRGR